ncbi:MAG: hypothetical protein GXO54_06940 [Chloroflexi bacterium]|nr:hypothetical protein [Chloroflexota bacterium]
MPRNMIVALWIGIGFVLIALALVIWGVSTTAGIALALGLIFGWSVWRWARTRRTWALWLAASALIAASALMLLRYPRQQVAGLLVKLTPAPGGKPPMQTLTVPIAFYAAQITMLDPRTGQGRVEHLGYTDPRGQGPAQNLGTASFQAQARGWWLMEAAIPTPNLPSGCIPGVVTVQGLPRGAFWAARGGQDIQRQPYLDEETITWRLRCAQAGITFAYLRPPWHHLRPLLAPFVSWGTLREGLFTFLVWLGSAVLAPVLAEFLQSWLKARMATLATWVREEV